MMAEIGKRTGVAILHGRIRLHGFVEWWLVKRTDLTIDTDEEPISKDPA
jgi:hypothetical protein